MPDLGRGQDQDPRPEYAAHSGTSGTEDPLNRQGAKTPRKEYKEYLGVSWPTSYFPSSYASWRQSDELDANDCARGCAAQPVDRAPNFDIMMQFAAHHIGQPLCALLPRLPRAGRRQPGRAGGLRTWTSCRPSPTLPRDRRLGRGDRVPRGRPAAARATACWPTRTELASAAHARPGAAGGG